MTACTFPNRQTALEIWKQGINYRREHDGWPPRFETEYLFHSLGIAHACARVATLIPGMDSEKAWVLGLLHDYGKRHDERKGEHFHALDGYEEMLRLGYTDVARICLTHSFPKKDFDFSAYGCSKNWLATAREKLENVKIDDYDRLVRLFDFMFEGMRITTFENRVAGIISRYHPKTPPTDLYNHALENKAYFESKIGQNIYQLFDVREKLPQLPTPVEAEILFEVIIWLRNLSEHPFTPEQEKTFRAHCSAVADIAATIAAATPDMDSERAYVLGLLHDCGRLRDEYTEPCFHGWVGYEFMTEHNFPDLARISITHTFYKQDFDPASYPQNRTAILKCRDYLQSITYNDDDRLIQLCDMLNNLGKTCTIEQRMADINRRYHIPEEKTQPLIKALQKIKGYFDGRCGIDVYDMLGLKERNV